MRTERARRPAAVAVVLLLTASCGFRSADAPAGSAVATQQLVTTTAAGTEAVDSITWALYRDPTSIDPITTGDYPELTVTSLLCESLFRQQPDGSLGPGLATKIDYPDPLKAVITLRQGVTFSDGTPMTAADVVFSIGRNRDPKAGGYWAPVFARVKSVVATDDHTVQLTLTEPDYWLQSALSFAAGDIVSKAAVTRAGKTYGTPKGGAVCTGPYKLKKWQPGDALTVERNDRYWNADVRPRVREIKFKGIPDESTLASGLQTGEVDGAYLELPVSSLDQLKKSEAVRIYRGPSFLVDAFIVADTDRGILKDPRVRQALSLAFDRDSYITSLYRGTAQPSRALGSPGTWGAQKATFEAAWQRLPEPTVDIAKAKSLIEAAGVSGQTITIGMSSEINKLVTEANAFKSAAEKIGLKVKLTSFSANAYGSLFLDQKARAQVDGFFTTNFPNWADPARLYATLAVPGAEQDYGAYRNPEVAGLLQKARGSADPATRADLTVQAQDILVKELPWIPIVAPDTVLVLNKKLSGATVSSQHFSAPWATGLGGVK
ncbi:ABC transporter substrate-binding protein [Kribbella solani]|uniref:Peptide/nickel transport system substrate-binding protein n=1 Tax=Kribbella solani TaxID=236067 RepID=A0A841DZW7_9ACTN|nr:ABC transporter substrate-binding protein [Kribbella solani]MBB5983719.1 peptide/nickel transport system substrate-binding protein [Kribbella solani]